MHIGVAVNKAVSTEVMSMKNAAEPRNYINFPVFRRK
jgi:hypothetical protein